MASVRWGGLRQEPFKPDAVDGDNDGIVQEGTIWERPVGTRFLTSDGDEFLGGLDGSDISQLQGLRLVDKDNKPVEYRQSWAQESLTIGERFGTIGSKLGTVEGPPARPPISIPDPTPSPISPAELAELRQDFPEFFDRDGNLKDKVDYPWTPNVFLAGRPLHDEISEIQSWSEFRDYLKGKRVVVFDTETTGWLNENEGKDRILQLGGVVYEDGKIVDRFNTFVNVPFDSLGDWSKNNVRTPDGELVSQEFFDQQPDITSVLTDFFSFANGPGDGSDVIFVAHNAPFDMKRMAMEHRRVSLETGFPMDQESTPYLDTMQIARAASRFGVEDAPRSAALKSLQQQFELPDFAWHSADADAEMTGQVMWKLVDFLEEKNAPMDILDPVQGLEFESGEKAKYAKAVAEYPEKVAMLEKVKERVDLAKAGESPGLGDYRMEHSAPTSDGGAPLHELTLLYPADVYGPGGAQLYNFGGTEDAAMHEEMGRIINEVRGNPDAEVTIYRAVPKNVDEINEGDWVTPVRAYAEFHGEGPMKGDYKIIESTVRAGDVFTDANSLLEWGYSPTLSDDRSSMRGKTGVPAGKALSDETRDILFTSAADNPRGAVQHGNGTLSVPAINEDGTFQTFDDDLEGRLDARYEAMGLSRDDLTINLAHSAMLAMGYDPVTGEFDQDKLEKGLNLSKWYSQQSDALRELAESSGVDFEHVVAAATVMSAGRLWSGPSNGNYESTVNLISILQDDAPIEVSGKVADFIKWRSAKGRKKPSSIGFDADLYDGKIVRPSELDSAQLVELLYAINSMRAYDTLDEWRKASNNGSKSPANNARVTPIYPLFTSKGTFQVKQAVSLLRGDVTVREGVSGPKYSSFFSNLVRPDLDYSCTNDTWHYRVMAGNLEINPLIKKGKLGTGTMRELTLKDEAKYGYWKVDEKTGVREWVGYTATAQDLFQTGLASTGDGLASGDLMFRDSTKMSRGALAALQLSHPEVFGGMKIHELQALVWVYYGGGTFGADEGLEIWDDALAKLPVDERWIDLV